VGENFRFGNRRHGDLPLLRRIGEDRGFEVLGVPPVQVDDTIVSSTAIRKALDEGRVEQARKMLGRAFEIRGEVVPGHGRGRGLGCPTANLDSDNEVLPRAGVYVTETVLLASRFPSVTNIGVRPTFGGETPTIETHLLGFVGDLYYERGSIQFLARLREEQRFDNVSDLADQIARDRAAAEAFFQNQPLGTQ
jgi:riboflavin kinase/FMN adenylyltransferase